MTGFAELAAATHYSFLRGASSPADMVRTAIGLGHTGIGIADCNSVAGVVRAHVALKTLYAATRESGAALPDFKLAVGARLVFADGTPDIVAGVYLVARMLPLFEVVRGMPELITIIGLTTTMLAA